MTNNNKQIQVIANRHLGSNYYLLTTQKPKDYHFLAGQFATLGLTINQQVIHKAMSIISSPQDDVLESFYLLVNGLFSKTLVTLKTHDTLFLAKHAHGFLTLSEWTEVAIPKTLWLIATDSGIAPYLAILKDESSFNRYNQIILWLEVSSWEHHFFQESLTKIMTQHPKVKVIIKINKQLFNNHHNLLLEEIDFLKTITVLSSMLVKTPLTPQTNHILLCGDPLIINNYYQQLKTLQFKKHRKREVGEILVEPYR